MVVARKSLNAMRKKVSLNVMRKKVSTLRLRVKELGDENRDLRDLCTENGVQYEERLAARRHKRYFACLCATHHDGRTAKASDVLGASPIV